MSEAAAEGPRPIGHYFVWMICESCGQVFEPEKLTRGEKIAQHHYLRKFSADGLSYTITPCGPLSLWRFPGELQTPEAIKEAYLKHKAEDPV